MQSMITTGSNVAFADYRSIVVWAAATQYPPRNPVLSGKPEDWAYSDLIWIRVRAIFKKKDGVEGEEVLRPAYTVLGKCVWPKVPVDHVPVSGAGFVNPATRTVWGEGKPFYESKGMRIDATHWYLCPEPLPPGTEISPIYSNAINLPVTVIVTGGSK